MLCKYVQRKYLNKLYSLWSQYAKSPGPQITNLPLDPLNILIWYVYIYIVCIYIYEYIYHIMNCFLFDQHKISVKSTVGSHMLQQLQPLELGGFKTTSSANSPTASGVVAVEIWREATVLNGDFIRLNKNHWENGSISWFFTFFVIQFRPGSTVEKRKGLEGLEISQNLKRARLLDLSLWVPLKVAAGSLVGNWKTLNVPSYEALVSFGPYTGRISVEAYFCWCPPKQGWIKSKVPFSSGRLKSH